MVKLKWNGKEDTLIRTERGGEKTHLRVGEEIEVTREQGDFYSKYDKRFELVTGDVKTNQIQKANSPNTIEAKSGDKNDNNPKNSNSKK